MCVCVCVCVSLLVVSDSARPWSVAHQGPLPTEFSRQEHWSELSFPSLGNLPDPGIEPGSPALQVDFYHLSHHIYVSCQITLSSVEVLMFYFQLSLMAQRLKHLPGMRETWLRSLVQEDPLKKEMATHSSTLAWNECQGGRSLVGYSPWGRKESDRTEQLYFHFPEYHYLLLKEFILLVDFPGDPVVKNLYG